MLITGYAHNGWTRKKYNKEMLCISMVLIHQFTTSLFVFVFSFFPTHFQYLGLIVISTGMLVSTLFFFFPYDTKSYEHNPFLPAGPTHAMELQTAQKMLQ